MHGQGLTVEVDKHKLLDALTANREKRLKEYEKASRGWRKLLRKQLVGLLDAVDGDQPLPAERLRLESRPTHYLTEYDEAIKMLTWASTLTVPLDQNQFRAYINDDWNWRNSWVAATSNYIANA